MSLKKTRDAIQEELSKRGLFIREYESWGFKFPNKDHVTSGGFVQCHAYDRTDANPSAGVAVNSGVYSDFTSSGKSKSFFDMAMEFTGKTLEEVIEYYCGYLDIKPVKSPGPEKQPRYSLVARKLWEYTARHVIARHSIKFSTLMDLGSEFGMYPRFGPTARDIMTIPVFKLTRGKPVRCGSILEAAGADGVIYLMQRGRHHPQELKRMSDGQAGVICSQRAIKNWDSIKSVIIVEGASDFLALLARLEGHPNREEIAVISSACGAADLKSKKNFGSMLEGKSVHIIPDCDQPGVDGALQWLDIASKSRAKLARVVNLGYEMGSKADLRVWLSDNPALTLDDLLSLPDLVECKMTKSEVSAVQPTESEEDIQAEKSARMRIAERHCEMLGLRVVCNLADSEKIQCYSITRQSSFVIKDIDRWGINSAIRYLGQPACDNISQDAEDADGISMDELTTSISLIASESPTHAEQDFIGPGIWSKNGSIGLVNSGSLSVFNGNKKLEKYSLPFFEGQFCDLTSNEEWYDHDSLSDMCDQAESPEFRRKAYEDVVSIFEAWSNLKRPSFDPCFLASAVGISLFGTTWTHRPCFGISGSSSSGKTTLRDTIGEICGIAAIKMDGPSEAGMRQEIGNSAKFVLCDEFEQSKHRSDVLRTLRVATRDGYITRGTPYGKSKRFRIRFVPWLFAIELGLVVNTDMSRVVQIGLDPLPKNAKLKIPRESEIADRGMRLIAAMLHSHADIVDRYNDILEHKPIGTREFDSYALIASVRGVLIGEEASDSLAWAYDAFPETEPDENETYESSIMRKIAYYTVGVGGGQNMSVGQLIAQGSHENELANIGISLKEDGVFVVPNALSDKVFKGEQISLREVLLREPGTEKRKLRVRGHKPTWGVLIPTAQFIGENNTIPGEQSQWSDDYFD